MFQKEYSWLPAFLMHAAQYAYQFPFWFRQWFYPRRSFTFRGQVHEYFEHPYNATWRNERAVEVPIIRELIDDFDPQSVLEVGNVLSHYYPVSHTVVDKYERGLHVLADDITNFRTLRLYEFIVSISTLEHVGWDETPRESGKHRRVVAHLRTLLAANGKMVVTVPLGYNHELDEDLGETRLGFDEYYFFRRTGIETWVEALWKDVKGSRYNAPFPKANALAICMVGNGNL